MSWTTIRAESGVYVGAGARVQGSLKAQARVVVDGAFDGDVACGELVVGARGVVTGSIAASDARINGRIDSVLVVGRTLSVGPRGRAEGALSYAELEIERGGVVSGALARAASAARRDMISRRKPGAPKLVYVNPKLSAHLTSAQQSG